MIKLMYLTTRKPGFTRDQFTRRWRLHGARSMATEFWRHALCYVQAEPVVPAPLAGASEAYDAIAIMVAADEAFTAERTATGIEEGKRTLEDELETFSGRILPATGLWVTEEKIRNGEPGGATAFLFFKDAAAARAGAEHCRDAREANRVTLNLKRPDAPQMGLVSGLPYEAIVEISASSVPILTRVMTTSGAPALRDADVSVVARECVLWDRISTVA